MSVCVSTSTLLGNSWFQNKEDMLEMDLTGSECEELNRISFAQDKDQWRSLVSKVMKLQVP
jgi:hypothetical protein